MCVCTLQPVDKLAAYCKELQELNMHSAPLTFALSCALEANKSGTANSSSLFLAFFHFYKRVIERVELLNSLDLLCFAAMSFQLMKKVKEQKLPVRPHYFWPLLTQHLKDMNPAGKCTHTPAHTRYGCVD